MNDKVIERVAKALFNHYWFGTAQKWEDHDHNHNHWLKLAKAAIEALLDLPEGSVIYQDCFEESIKSILGK